MKNGGIRRLVFFTAVLAASAGLWGADHYRVVNGPKDFYFGHISYIEPTAGGTDPVVIREGRPESEPGVLNTPIGPGDTVRTSADRRCEIQFDTGTIVRLDAATELRVETILARSLSAPDALSVLNLGQGRIYVMYKEYARREMFQVLTANAAVKLRHNSVALISAASDGTTETQVRYGRAQVLFGSDPERLDDRAVKKGERLIVLKDHQFELAAAIDGTAFELWNSEVNAHFEDLHEGLTSLPKPLQKLPPAVFYFAQTYGNRYGEWLWDDFYGYVWRPFIDNGTYPWGWSPYYYGQWSYAAGQMFWVPQEPWGWIPYHLGVWQWDKKHGWFWLPGSMFAPAWATWDFYFGYAAWRPWSLYDWMYDGSYWASGLGWSGDGLYYSPYWANDPNAAGSPGRTVVRKGSLKQPASSSLPIPAELRGLVKKVTTAYAGGDPRIRGGADEISRRLVLVAKDDLASRAIHEKTLTLDAVSKRTAVPAGEAAVSQIVPDPRREAARTFLGVDGPVTSPRKVPAPESVRVEGRGITAYPSAPAVRTGLPARRTEAQAMRFRDWNPDLRVARELGVRIEYSSARNEVRCPELNLSSRDRERATGLSPHLTSHGVSYGPAVSVGGGYAGGSSASPSASPSARSAGARSEGASTATRGEAKSGGEGGKIKN
jgi:hypothetical protein